MIARRVGLVLAVILSALGLAPALDIQPAPTGGSLLLPVLGAITAGVVAIGTLALLVPAWRGGRRAGIVVASLQLLAALSGLPAFFVPEGVVPPGGVLSAAVGCLLGVAVAALILIDYSGALMYLLAATAVIAIYAALVAVVSALVPPEADRAVATIGALVVALLFPPVSSLVRRLVGRPLFGGRVDPAGTALSLGHTPGQEGDAIEAALAEVARAMRLRAAELTLDGETLATVGDPGDDDPGLSFDLEGDPPLVFHTWLRGRRSVDPADRTALHLVAHTLGALARELLLSAQLRDARGALVQARATEREAIHRDLHDGLGPTLTGIVLRADAAQNLLEALPDAAAGELRRARSDLRLAIAEVRRIAYGLRPLADVSQFHDAARPPSSAPQ